MERMVVEAPSQNSAPLTLASHAPRVASDSDEEMPLVRKPGGKGTGNGHRVGAYSDRDEDKKPLVSQTCRAK